MTTITKVPSETDVIKTLCNRIEKIANSSIESNGIFRIGLSGGSLIKYLATGLPDINTTWSKWQLFFCDERYVPDSDADSTFGAYKEQLIPKVNELTEEQFLTVKYDLSLKLNQVALAYETEMRSKFQISNNEIPVFDLLLLGMGPDGHTCSLFPGHRLLNVTDVLIVPIDDSPKPPPKRVTMTYTLINAAKNVLFAMAGSGKADMIKVSLSYQHLVLKRRETMFFNISENFE